MDSFDHNDIYNELNRKLSGGTADKAPVSGGEADSERSEGGGLWFVVLTPLIGLVLQSFAVSKWAGIYLWVMIAAALVIGTVLDYRSVCLNHPECDTAQLKKYIPIAPLYVLHREKLLGHELYKAFVLGSLIFAALAMNNFVMSLKINADSIPGIIEDTPVSSLDNFSGKSTEYIGDKLKDRLGEDYTSECTKDGHTYTAVFTGKHDDKPEVIEIEVIHDGFVYQTFKVTAVTTCGERLEGDDLDDILKEIFLPEDDDTQDEEDAEDEAEEAEEDTAA